VQIAQLVDAYARRKQFEARLLAGELGRVLSGPKGRGKGARNSSRPARPQQVGAAEFLRTAGVSFS